MVGSGVYLAPGAALDRVRRIARAEGSAWTAGSPLEAAAIDALTQRVLDDSVPYLSSNPNGQLLPAHLAKQGLRPSPELRPRGRRRWHRFPRVHQLPAEVPEDVRRLWGFLHTGRSFREGWGELCHEDIHGRSFGWYAEADCQRLLHGLEGLAEGPLVELPGSLSAEQVALAEDIGRNLLAAVASDGASAAASPESIARGAIATFRRTADPSTFDLVRAVAAEALEAGGSLVFMAR
jgi:hypothetical protein